MDGEERDGGEAADAAVPAEPDDQGATRRRYEPTFSASPPRLDAAAPYPQAVRQLAGALVVLAGCLLPFGPALTTSLVPDDALAALRGGPGTPPRTLGAMPACATFIGACWLALAIVVLVRIGATLRERRASLAPALFVLPCGWSFATLAGMGGRVPGFDWGWLGRLDRLNQLALEVGSGFFLVWLGSTFVVLDFFLALAGALTLGRRRLPAIDTGPAGSRRSGAGAARASRRNP